MSLRVIGESEFDEVVLASPVPVLVDFFTVWCGPCKALAPTLVDLAEEYGERVRIVSVDAEQSPGLKDRYGVTGYPTMVLVKDGAEVSRPTARSRMQLREVLDEALGAAHSVEAASAPLEVPPAVAALLDQLLALDDDAWAQVEAAVTKESEPSKAEPGTPDKSVDEEAMTAALTRLQDDVEELAKTRLCHGPLAPAVASAAAATFDRWVRQAPLRPGWMGAFRFVPAARMSPYLPEGEAPADPTVAAARFRDALAALDDTAWDDIRRVSQDFFPWVDHAKRTGVNAWLAAVILIQSIVSAELLPAETRAAVLSPFAGVLPMEAVA